MVWAPHLNKTNIRNINICIQRYIQSILQTHFFCGTTVCGCKYEFFLYLLSRWIGFNWILCWVGISHTRFYVKNGVPTGDPKHGSFWLYEAIPSSWLSHCVNFSNKNKVKLSKYCTLSLYPLIYTPNYDLKISGT